MDRGEVVDAAIRAAAQLGTREPPLADFLRHSGVPLAVVEEHFGSYDGLLEAAFPDPDDPSFAGSPTLTGVVSRLGGPHDPELRSRLDRAFSKHHARLRAVVARELRGRPEQEIEDAVQEVLLVAWRRLPGQRIRSFRGWLVAIAMHVCANERRRVRDHLTRDGLFDPGSEAASAYSALRAEERQRLFLEAARRALDPAEQDVLYMRYELDLPLEDIARLGRLPDANEVRVVLQRCKRRLARSLEEVMHEVGHGRSVFRSDG